ncbi:MAG: aminotransferase class V-fold PLP-dependent enzyme [Ignavibacteria bacterium]|nr:aminotransferase class V-fold PLP-dependent enzyme [Ignavibacteria bacterium]
MLDLEYIREEFPITKKSFQVYGSTEPRNLVYLDHGASTHPCSTVLNKYIDFIKNYYSNVHRGKHYLSMISTELFDRVYETILKFINASKEDNAIVLTANTTSALDMTAWLMKDYEGITLVSLMEHHSNDLPHRHRGEIMHFGVNPDGTLDMTDLENKLNTNKVKLVAVTGASNVTGFITDIHKIAALAHKHGARILIDAAQLLAHKSIDVKPNDDPEHIDFLAAAGHKAYAPFGSAFLFGPRDVLDRVEPYVPGGGTVLFVSENDYIYANSPDRHQGGTPNIAGAIALAESLNFLSKAGMENIRRHEIELTEYALARLKEIPDINILGNIPADKRLGVITFNIGDINNGLVADILNHEAAIATRNGRFCAHPYLSFLLGRNDAAEIIQRIRAGEKFDIGGAVRISFGIFNNEKEVDYVIDNLKMIAGRNWKANYDDTPEYFDCKGVQLSAS